MSFFKSSHSLPTGACVEVSGTIYGTVLVRHSKRPTGLVLEFDANEWAAFIQGVKAGEFDLVYHEDEQ